MGLLGLPNAGKSTLISVVSAARPKIADYPFTTLYPNLGVVACGNQRSFVMADIPGLIEGAADGAGLGIRFLKHLQRTRVLLHLVDIAPVDPAADPVRDANSIVAELNKFSEDLLTKPRWLVLNKSDLLLPEEATAKAIAIARALKYSGPAFLISGATRAWHRRSHRSRDAFPRDRRGAGRGKPGDPGNADSCRETEEDRGEGQGKAEAKAEARKPRRQEGAGKEEVRGPQEIGHQTKNPA